MSCNHQCPNTLAEGAGPSKCLANACSKLRTYRLREDLGVDEEGQPYAPKLGAYRNAIVTYEANGAIYIYDDEGIYTKLK